VDSGAARAAGTVEELLAGYGIPVVPGRLVAGADAAVAAAEELGYPVVLKVADPALRHRVDLGAVRLDLADPADVRRACTELDKLFSTGAALIVQPQVPPGTSWVVEVVEDPAFGPIVGFGPGGVLGELAGDRAWRAAPLTEADAAALVREPKAAPLLLGYRGAERASVGAMVDLLLRVGLLADEQTRVRGLRLNPVLARPDGVSVLHASVHFGRETPRPDSGPRHLSSRTPPAASPATGDGA
jgi:acyl-CoA synthetase (NDP forming)